MTKNEEPYVFTYFKTKIIPSQHHQGRTGEHAVHCLYGGFSNDAAPLRISTVASGVRFSLHRVWTSTASVWWLTLKSLSMLSRAPEDLRCSLTLGWGLHPSEPMLQYFRSCPVNAVLQEAKCCRVLFWERDVTLCLRPRRYEGCFKQKRVCLFERLFELRPFP